jgi:uncharacterized membrane protein YqaE (UPF0057 family)
MLLDSAFFEMDCVNVLLDYASEFMDYVVVFLDDIDFKKDFLLTFCSFCVGVLNAIFYILALTKLSGTY